MTYELSENKIVEYARIPPVHFLYASYILFFGLQFVKVSQSALHEYVFGIASAILYYVGIVFSTSNKSNSKYLYLLVLSLFALLPAIFLKGGNHYLIVFSFYISAVCLFFYGYEIKIDTFVTFLNRTYLAYFLLSFIVWAGIIPNIFYSQILGANNIVSIGNLFGYHILYGIEGSPAHIDSYSALILMVNVFLSSRKDRLFYSIVAALAIMLSFRATPIVALTLSFACYKFVKTRTSAMVAYFSVFTIFVVLLSLIVFVREIEINGMRYDLWVIGYILTSARTMIWLQQIEVFFENYNLSDYLFGGYHPERFAVTALQIWGQETGSYYNNPHNTFLLLLFRSPFLFAVGIASFVKLQYSKFSRKEFPILFIVFLSGMTNSSIISLGNPIYILTIAYVLLNKKEQKIEEA